MIPDSPEQLFDAIADTSIHLLYPDFDNLNLRQQQLVRLIHVELTKGQLNDGSFVETIHLILNLWRRFTTAAHMTYHEGVLDRPSFDIHSLRVYDYYSRMHQYFSAIEHILASVPLAELAFRKDATYRVSGPGDDS